MFVGCVLLSAFITYTWRRGPEGKVGLTCLGCIVLPAALFALFIAAYTISIECRTQTSQRGQIAQPAIQQCIEDWALDQVDPYRPILIVAVVGLLLGYTVGSTYRNVSLTPGQTLESYLKEPPSRAIARAVFFSTVFGTFVAFLASFGNSPSQAMWTIVAVAAFLAPMLLLSGGTRFRDALREAGVHRSWLIISMLVAVAPISLVLFTPALVTRLALSSDRVPDFVDAEPTNLVVLLTLFATYFFVASLVVKRIRDDIWVRSNVDSSPELWHWMNWRVDFLRGTASITMVLALVSLPTTVRLNWAWVLFASLVVPGLFQYAKMRRFGPRLQPDMEEKSSVQLAVAPEADAPDDGSTRSLETAIPRYDLSNALQHLQKTGNKLQRVVAANDPIDVFYASGLHPKAFETEPTRLSVPHLLLELDDGQRWGITGVNVGYPGGGPARVREFLKAAGLHGDLAKAIAEHWSFSDTSVGLGKSTRSSEEKSYYQLGGLPRSQGSGYVVELTYPGLAQKFRGDSTLHQDQALHRNRLKNWIEFLDSEECPSWARGARAARVFVDSQEARCQGFIIHEKPVDIVLEQGVVQLWIVADAPRKSNQQLNSTQYAVLALADLESETLTRLETADGRKALWRFVVAQFGPSRPRFIDVGGADEGRLQYVPTGSGGKFIRRPRPKIRQG